MEKTETRRVFSAPRRDNANSRRPPSALGGLSRKFPPTVSGYFQKLISVLAIFVCAAPAFAADDSYLNLQPQQPGDHTLHILSPRLLELELINTKQPAPAPVDSWDWINTNGNFAPPNLSSLRVTVNGRTNAITATGFKRRPIFAPLSGWDLRI